MTLALRYTARSDRGLVRSNNEDSVYAGPRLLAVADGMGGHVGGEIASRVVIASVTPLDDADPAEDLLGALRDAAVDGNSAIAATVEEEPELAGMGTTLTALLFADDRVGLLNVGDSRAYLMRDDELVQITHDDTFVQSLVDAGRITIAEAEVHPKRSLVLRALTGEEVVETTTELREVRAGDRYLLCSDGLTDVLNHAALSVELRIGDHEVCADRLIEAALAGGGPDNVTVIVADVTEVSEGAGDAEAAAVAGGSAGSSEPAAVAATVAPAGAAAADAPDADSAAPDSTAPDGIGHGAETPAADPTEPAGLDRATAGQDHAEAPVAPTVSAWFTEADRSSQADEAQAAGSRDVERSGAAGAQADPGWAETSRPADSATASDSAVSGHAPVTPTNDADPAVSTEQATATTPEDAGADGGAAVTEQAAAGRDESSDRREDASTTDWSAAEHRRQPRSARSLLVGAAVLGVGAVATIAVRRRLGR
ncbi:MULTISPECIES: protein phosphatase 2C domain-containing protein [Actinoalloteichus]|uniref:Serine/threonine protein phosphatase n=1 Tax=Actinoalloteichus fjordicus TaxID=1612552 RepID=A0AAC9PQV4_9PSEU|nr:MULTISPECIES: protein phosphatase 2C domain-containing protein [Actinoalloteichus]APU13594.1 serine/threonine protein phosphatase [Actinoalloteichus fjordicus]APU19541.1 serine/threonine protein phosphatase [Actinoalloteichus sp. GBA129-24]